MSETAAIVSPALALLHAAGVLCWRNQVGAAKRRGFQVRFGAGKGSPDIMGILRCGKAFGIECKIDIKKSGPTQEQLAWRDMLLKRNAYWGIAESAKEALMLVKTWERGL